MNPYIIDATLREGKQSLRNELPNSTILRLAEKIISLGVDQLEVGHAAISPKEISALRSIKANFPDVSLLTHSRAMVSDVEKAIEAGVDWIGIFISTNQYAKYRIRDFSIEKVIDSSAQSIALAKSNGLKVRFTIEDSTRTNPQLLRMVYENAIALGADRICLADTLGILEPKEVEQTVKMLRAHHPEIPLEVHFHNDRGLAMANALQAISAGACWISASVNGIGERAGITDTCLLLANLHYMGLRAIDANMNIKEVSEMIASATHLAVDPHRPVIGEKAFMHVADLHVKAMKKHSGTYNWIDPTLLGQQTQCVETSPPPAATDALTPTLS